MTASQFLDLFGRSQLAASGDPREFLNGTDGAEQLAAALISAGLLTRWQADKLLAGKWKGFILDGYKLLDHHRKNAASQEYVAEHLLTNRKVILTVAPSQFVDDPGFWAVFLRECGGRPIHENNGTRYAVRDYVEDNH